MLTGMLAAGCSHSAGPAAGEVSARLADCGGSPQVRPTVVVVLCADSGITAHSLRWSGWGEAVATASGTAVVNTCEYNDCHTGSYRAYPIVLVLSRLSPCPGGQRGYRRLQYMFVGPPPFREGVPAPDKAAPRAFEQGGASTLPTTVPGMTGPGCG
jgi:hypothetical protein